MSDDKRDEWDPTWVPPGKQSVERIMSERLHALVEEVVAAGRRAECVVMAVGGHECADGPGPLWTSSVLYRQDAHPSKPAFLRRLAALLLELAEREEAAAKVQCFSGVDGMTGRTRGDA